MWTCQQCGAESDTTPDECENCGGVHKEGTPPGKASWRPLLVLLGVHIVCGIGLGFFANVNGPVELGIIVFVGVLFSQTSLLGLWGGLAIVGLPVRFIGVTIGIAYLIPLYSLSASDWGFEVMLLIFFATAVVACVMLVVRWRWARLENITAETFAVQAEGLQFSIRHLMILTFVIACTLGAGRWLRPVFHGSAQWSELFVFGLCFVIVALISAWAMLGRSYVLLRTFVVLVICASMGGLLAFLLDREAYWTWILLLLTEASAILASLYVVRRAGYRLVRLR